MKTTQQDLVLRNASFVSILPPTPKDGDQVLYQNAAMATQGSAWYLRYRAGSVSTMKWEFVSGPPLSQVQTSDTNLSTVAGAAWQNLGKTITVPLAGDYLVDISASLRNISAACTFYLGLMVGAVDNAPENLAPPSWRTPSATVAQNQWVVARALLRNSLVAGAVLTPRFWHTAAA